MIPKGLFSQLIMIGIAVAIVFTYIQPTLTNIQTVQEDIAEYQAERAKVSEVNKLLEKQVADVEAISTDDKSRLVTYLPDDVDIIEVPRTVEAIALEAGVLFKGIVYESVSDRYLDEESSGAVAVPHLFSVTVDGTYSQIKTMLSLMEQNNYPLEVHELTIDVLEGGFLSATMQVVTYANDLPAPSAFIE